MFADFKYICLQTYSGLLVQRGLLDLNTDFSCRPYSGGRLDSMLLFLLAIICLQTLYLTPIYIISTSLTCFTFSWIFLFSTWVWESVLHWTSPYTLGLWVYTHWTSPYTLGLWVCTHWTSPYTLGLWVCTPLDFSVYSRFVSLYPTGLLRIL